MSRRRREALLEIARRYGTWVVEDSPYRAIRFEGTADPTLLALDQSANVIHVGTFSKLLAPGIRVGWVVAPPEILARMNALSDSTPVLVDLKPTGSGYMEDLHAAGVNAACAIGYATSQQKPWVRLV